MTDKQCNELTEKGLKIREEVKDIHDRDEFICLICTTIDEWCKMNRKNPCKTAFMICHIIQEAKGVKK